jgi:hypothetical protein
MADPITWKNVNQDPSAVYVAGNLLKGAGDSFASGIDQLKGVYNDYQKGLSQENTAAYEAELAKYTTPEALKAAQDSGVLANLGKQFGLQMDQGVLKNGVRNAQTSLMGDVTAANAYTDMGETRAIQTPAQALALKLETDAAKQKILEQAASDANKTAGLTQNGLQNQLDEFKANAPVRDITREGLLGAGKGVLSTQADTVNFDTASREIASGVLPLTQARDLPDGHPNKVSEKDANQRINQLILDAGKRYNLTQDQISKQMTQTGLTMNGTPITGVRLAEQERAIALQKTITEHAQKNTDYYQETLRPKLANEEALATYVKTEFNPDGWGDANPKKALTLLNSYLGKSVEIDGRMQPITPSILIAVMKSGTAQTNWFASSQSVGKNKLDDAIKEVMNRSSFKQAFGVTEALNAGNHAALLKALNLK